MTTDERGEGPHKRPFSPTELKGMMLTDHDDVGQAEAVISTAIESAKKEAIEKDRFKRLDLDVRGLIGLMSVFGLFGVVFAQLATGAKIAIPAEVAGVVGSVVGFYFGSRGGDRTNGFH